MKERPILFNAPMVRALLDGSKTQTRRVANGVVAVHSLTGEPLAQCDSAGPRVRCPYGQPGDRLWVRETIRKTGEGEWSLSEYAADGTQTVADCWPWKNPVLPSIHCPRGLSRILLEITGVRVERLQDISEADCWKEGIDAVDGALDDMDICRLAKQIGTCIEDARPTFAALWESINGGGSWKTNPWVWCIDFKRISE